mmetsp:Transcript_19631/g.52085  ORF Transcript_19631/g.52085 Transcript_19631/m.52085 type:complete len:291 (+) Transcript_19631:1529-2401(+)
MVLAARSRAVALPERVATGDEGDRLFVIHRHPAERLPDMPRRQQRVRNAVRALGIHVDQRLHDGRQRLLQVLRRLGQPFEGVGGAPVHVVLAAPAVDPAPHEPEGLEAHVLHSHVAHEHQKIGPRKLLPVLLLDRPQETARLVQVAVVVPGIQGIEAHVSAVRPPTAIRGPIRSGLVPGEAHHERAVVAPVSGPPRLGVLEGGRDVLLHLRQVQRREQRHILLARQAVVDRVQDLEVELLGTVVHPVLHGQEGALAAGGVAALVLGAVHQGAHDGVAALALGAAAGLLVA